MEYAEMTVNTDWSGASGKSYTYEVHNLDWVPATDQDGNYVFAKLSRNTWYAVYVGEGDIQERMAAALDRGCVTRKGATHFHCHLNDNKRSRLDEEGDVLNGNPEAFEPEGCNSPR